MRHARVTKQVQEAPSQHQQAESGDGMTPPIPIAVLDAGGQGQEGCHHQNAAYNETPHPSDQSDPAVPIKGLVKQGEETRQAGAKDHQVQVPGYPVQGIQEDTLLVRTASGSA